ncbi:hypothetical protein [Tautonia plasticadhaerens]|uniref:Uncharacterized protein n=1 Tax=Tautonia plasticadhaerens TaxID=2527974 RepID=A0A518H9T9_9BACT|nr:hypothetical protein [Tautonia plasticadhaerens]QDV37613.1 hypothetical protein ElP_55540 [Tautonia plasticadhaerens]
MSRRIAWYAPSPPLFAALTVLGMAIWPAASLLVHAMEAPTIPAPPGPGGVPDVGTIGEIPIDPGAWAIPNGNDIWDWLNCSGRLRVAE